MKKLISIMLFFSIFQLSLQTSDEARANQLMQIANAQRQGLPLQAAHLYGQAGAAYEQSKDYNNMANAYNQAAELYNSVKNYPNVIKAYEQLAIAYQRTNNTQNLAIIYTYMGDVYTTMKDISAATQAYNIALKVYIPWLKAQGLWNRKCGQISYCHILNNEPTLSRLHIPVYNDYNPQASYKCAADITSNMIKIYNKLNDTTNATIFSKYNQLFQQLSHDWSSYSGSWCYEGASGYLNHNTTFWANTNLHDDSVCGILNNIKTQLNNL